MSSHWSVIFKGHDILWIFKSCCSTGEVVRDMLFCGAECLVAQEVQGHAVYENNSKA
jgi:hypothetical protein